VLGLSGYLLALVVHAPVAQPMTLASTEQSRSEQAFQDYEQQLEKDLLPNPTSLPTPYSPLPTPHPPSRFIQPAQGILTSGYGWRWGRMHRGIDIAGPVGTPILASAAGEVVFSGWNNGGYGNLVEIRHQDGTITRYAHNSQLLVSVGQAVRQGDAIALMGSTGYSTGPHCHFEIILPGKGAVNPIALLPK